MLQKIRLLDIIISSKREEIEIEIELTQREAFELHTFIRRSIFEDYIRAMDECNQTQEQTNDRVYEVIYALNKIRKEIEKN